jgi:putative membrane protein
LIGEGKIDGSERSRTTNELAEIRNELAKMRNRDAADRTLMAWIRTGLSLIGFGFGIDKIVDALAGTRIENTTNLMTNVRIFGMGFIGIGVFSLLVASILHRSEIKRIESTDYTYRAPFPLALLVAVLVALIGLFTFFSILIQVIG